MEKKDTFDKEKQKNHKKEHNYGLTGIEKDLYGEDSDANENQQTMEKRDSYDINEDELLNPHMLSKEKYYQHKEAAQANQATQKHNTHSHNATQDDDNNNTTKKNDSHQPSKRVTKENLLERFDKEDLLCLMKEYLYEYDNKNKEEKEHLLIQQTQEALHSLYKEQENLYCVMFAHKDRYYEDKKRAFTTMMRKLLLSKTKKAVFFNKEITDLLEKDILSGCSSFKKQYKNQDFLSKKRDADHHHDNSSSSTKISHAAGAGDDDILSTLDYFENEFFSSHYDIDIINAQERKKVSCPVTYKNKTLFFYNLLTENVFTSKIAEFRASRPHDNAVNNNNNTNTNSSIKEVRNIGMSKKELLGAKKYGVVNTKMPVFANIFDDPVMKNSENMFDRAFQKRTSLKVELQNIQKLKQIEEKRNKHKNTPLNIKENMDIANLEKHWSFLVKKEIPRRHKEYQKFKQDVEYNCKRTIMLCQKEAKKRANKVVRQQKEAALKLKKQQKDMVSIMKKKEKEENEQKKKDLEKLKKQQELQEAVKQKKRLEYLMTQSDIYSFFMAKKMGMEEEKDKTVHDDKKGRRVIEQIGSEQVEVLYDENNNKKTLRVVVDKEEAMKEVQNLLKSQKDNLAKFDEQCNTLRQRAGGEAIEIDKATEVSKQELDMENRLDNPFISMNLEAPDSFKGSLKHYQLKGLNWLDNLFEQGINGILADEMGLGKTIQAISLLANLAERRNIWGPFLVISPNATLYNWQQEVNKFCPSLSVLPYWGGIKERKLLRKYFNPLNLYTKNSPFHVCITSYQFIVQDQKVFNKINWQYMILDEAHSIKNVNSIRWNTLLQFTCRNRLLLTGTPIQNSMSELWALLHFIMPNLFDSHEQFQEWFSKDIEAHSQEKGELNEEQLRRLHKILKPFMLRRVKKDVENEIGPKTEYEIYCNMSKRQKILYNSIRSKLNNISDLFTSVESKTKVDNLMNLVMQFRKVCNHPELFERHMGKMPFFFRNLFLITSNLNVTSGNNVNSMVINNEEILNVHADNRSALGYCLPKLLYDDLMNVDSVHGIHKSALLYQKISSDNHKFHSLNTFKENPLLFLRLTNNFSVSFAEMFPGLAMTWSDNEIRTLFSSNEIVSLISLLHFMKTKQRRRQYLFFSDCDKRDDDDDDNIFMLRKYRKSFFDIFITREVFGSDDRISSFCNIKKDLSLDSFVFCPDLPSLNKELRAFSVVRSQRCFIPNALSSPVNIFCSSKPFLITHNNMLYKDKNTLMLLYGTQLQQIRRPVYHNNRLNLFSASVKDNTHLPVSFIKKFVIPNTDNKVSNSLVEVLEKGVMYDITYENPDSTSTLELPSFNRLINESSKLKELDNLLEKLYKDGHRVLIFCQMTKMIDIIEEYMTKKRFTYFRMDGSTNIADRRDMVNEFQNTTSTFAFILSTRAGGLGVNLTAADTVIFYDIDWNPTMDAQATDRAHRIGQTKPVSVYRIITKNSVEERILKRAKQKQNVQTTVYSGGAFKTEVFKQAEIFELLYSDEEVLKMEEERRRIHEEYQANLLKKKQQLEEVELRRQEKKQKREEERIKKEEEKRKKEEERRLQREIKEQKEIENKIKPLFAVKHNVKKAIFKVWHNCPKNGEEYYDHSYYNENSQFYDDDDRDAEEGRVYDNNNMIVEDDNDDDHDPKHSNHHDHAYDHNNNNNHQ